MVQDARKEDTVASASLQLEAQQSGDASEALHTTDPLREPRAAPAIQGTQVLLRLVALHTCERHMSPTARTPSVACTCRMACGHGRVAVCQNVAVPVIAGMCPCPTGNKIASSKGESEEENAEDIAEQRWAHARYTP